MHVRLLIAMLVVLALGLSACDDADVDDEVADDAATEADDESDADDDGGANDDDGESDDDSADDDADAETSLTLEVEPAEGWEEADEEELAEAGGLGSAQVLSNPDACEGEACARFYALVTPSPVDDPEEYHQMSREEIEGRLGADIVSESEVEIDGHPGYEYEYEIEAEDGKRHQLLREAVIDGEVVVLAYTADSTDLFGEWREDGEAMLDSVTVVEAE